MLKRLLAGTVAAALLSACGGGASQSALPASSSSTGKSIATLSIKVPGKTVNVRGKRVPLYTSRDAKGIGIDIQSSSSGTYPNTPNYSPEFGAALAAGSGGCGVAGSDGSYTCSFAVPAPVGYDSVRTTLWNAAPSSCGTNGNGCSFSGDQPLGSNVSNATIYAGSSNTVAAFTLMPVVDSMSVQVSGGIQNGSTNTLTAFIVLKDAAGDTILGNDQLIDNAGNALLIYPAIVNNNPGCAVSGQGVPLAAGGCSLYFASGTGYATASAATSVTVNYDGAYSFPVSGSVPQVTAAAYNGGSADALAGGITAAAIGVMATSAGVTAGTAPQYGAHATLSSAPAQFAPSGNLMVSGYDGYIYALEGGVGTTTMERFNPSTPGTLQTVSLATSRINAIANGTDNALWYLDDNAQKIYQQPYGTSSSGAVSVVDQHLGDIVANLVAGPDGNMWFIRNLGSGGNAGGELESVTPAMTFATTTTVTNNPAADPKFARGALAAGTFPNGDQAVCTADLNRNIDCWDITAGAWKSYAAGIVAGNVTFGGDGNLYYATNTNVIRELTMSAGNLALVSTYTLGAGESPASMTQGYDGNVWFALTGGSNRIGRISVASQTACSGVCAGYLSEWGNTVKLPGSPQLQRIIAGPDHNLWVSDTGNTSVDQILP